MAETMTAPAASSSTHATAPKAPKTWVVRKGGQPRFTGQRLAEDGLVTLRGGKTYAHAGDILLADADGHAIDVMPSSVFEDLFEPIVEGKITLSPAQITRCAKVLPIGSTKTPEAFTKAIESRVAVEGVELAFSPGQRAELQHRAQKRGWATERYLQYLLDRFLQDFGNL